MRPTSNPNVYVIDKGNLHQPTVHHQSLPPQSQTYRIITTTDCNPTPSNQTVTQTGQFSPQPNQLIQYVPTTQTPNNFITLMSSNVSGTSWSNQEIGRTIFLLFILLFLYIIKNKIHQKQVTRSSPSRRRNKSPAIIKKRFQSPKKSPRQIRPKQPSSIQAGY